MPVTPAVSVSEGILRISAWKESLDAAGVSGDAGDVAGELCAGLAASNLCGLRRDHEFAVGVDAVAHLAQIAEDAAADRDFVSCAEMAEIESVLGCGGDARGGGCVEPELLERLSKGNARRGDFIGVHDYIALNVSSFFARERDFVCELRFGFAARRRTTSRGRRRPRSRRTNQDMILRRFILLRCSPVRGPFAG